MPNQWREPKEWALQQRTAGPTRFIERYSAIVPGVNVSDAKLGGLGAAQVVQTKVEQHHAEQGGKAALVGVLPSQALCGKRGSARVVWTVGGARRTGRQVSVHNAAQRARTQEMSLKEGLTAKTPWHNTDGTHGDDNSAGAC